MRTAQPRLLPSLISFPFCKQINRPALPPPQSPPIRGAPSMHSPTVQGWETNKPEPASLAPPQPAQLSPWQPCASTKHFTLPTFPQSSFSRSLHKHNSERARKGLVFVFEGDENNSELAAHKPIPDARPIGWAAESMRRMGVLVQFWVE